MKPYYELTKQGYWRLRVKKEVGYMRIYCACEDLSCQVSVTVEDAEHFMLQSKTGELTLMYLDKETRKMLIKALKEATECSSQCAITQTTPV